MSKTLILVGSPKNDPAKSSSFYIADAMKTGMTGACDIRQISKENMSVLMDALPDYSTILLVTPNYIHSVPTPVLRFLYALPEATGDQRFGVIVQSGFPELRDSAIVCRYIDKRITGLNYRYLGSAVMGDAAAYGLAREMFDKKIPVFAELGRRLEADGVLDKAYMKEMKLAEHETLPDRYIRQINFLNAIGLGKLVWIMQLRKHKAYGKRYDRPFAE